MPLTRITNDAIAATAQVNAESLTTGTIPLARLSAANSSANGILTTTTQSLAGDKTFLHNITVTGNLTVLGTAVTLNSENVLIKDNILTLNSNVSGAPVLDAGIEVNRGSSANVTLKWNETVDQWQLTNDGTNYANLASINAGGVMVFPSGGSLDFNSGDVTLTHSANTMTWAGASAGYNFNDGNMGIGLVNAPALNAWESTWRVLQLNRDASFGSASGGAVHAFIGTNIYATANGSPATATWKYNLTGSAASLYEQLGGSHLWSIAGNGNAGAIVSFTQAMTLDANGNVGVGTTSPGYAAANRNLVYVNGAVSSLMGFGANNTNIGYVLATNTSMTVWTEGARALDIGIAGAGALSLITNNTTRLSITSAGNVGINTSSPTYRLTVITPTSDATVGFNLRAYTTGTDGARTVISRYTSSNDNNWAISKYTAWSHIFQCNATDRIEIDSSGHLRPSADNTSDLGTASYRWRNVYSADLQLSNEGSSNDVDGTWGSWTIQEGEHNLFLLNRRTKKKYKFVIEEVQ